MPFRTFRMLKATVGMTSSVHYGNFSLLNGNSLCATHNVPALNQEHLQRMSSRMPRQSVAHDFLKPELYMQCSQPTYLQSNHTYLCTLREEKTSKPTKEGSEVRHGRVKTKGDSKKGSRCVSSSCHISWAASVSTSGSHRLGSSSVLSS